VQNNQNNQNKTNVVLFWSSKYNGETPEQYRNTELELSVFTELTLESHKKYNNTELYTYQKIKNVPSHITIKDANEIFPFELAFDALKRNHSIAHISDAVRLKRALEINGVVLDLDAVQINPFPDIPCFTCTMPAKTSGGLAIKWGKSHPPFIIHDGSWDGKALSAFPIKVHKCIEPEINALIDRIIKCLSEEPMKDTKGWNYIMWELKNIANNNPAVKVLEPIRCCPVPAWKSAGNCYTLESPTKFDGKSELFGYKLPSIDEIFEKSYVVQHFFESSFKNSEKSKADFFYNVKPGSVLYKEMEHIFGKDNKYFKLISTDEW